MISNLKLNNKVILVTGGAGFIGSNLCEYLLSCNAIVRCLDDFSTGHKSNISSFLSNSNFLLIEGDICDIETCQLACKDVDFVLHQAALGSVPRSINNPIMTNKVNISGFLNMLVASRDNKIKRFVYAASSSTYGDSDLLPKTEDVIGKPLSPYAVTKYVNELYADNFHKQFNLDSIGLRYFNVFGRRQDPNGAYAAVIPKFISQLLNYDSPIINGDGLHSRDFTYIDNVIQMNILALTTSNKKSINQIYNTAVGAQTNLLELIDCIKKYLGNYDSKIFDVKTLFRSNRQGDVLHSLASIEKAKKMLLFKPSHDLNQGIKASISWYMKNIKNE